MAEKRIDQIDKVTAGADEILRAPSPQNLERAASLVTTATVSGTESLTLPGGISDPDEYFDTLGVEYS